jgi:capsular exopolysaccharide synthesis family protein
MSFSVVPPRDVARSLQQQVQARIERGASMLAVRLEGTNPWFVAQTVNAIAQGFVDTARSLSISKHRELTQTLRLQLDSVERRLRDAEGSYTQYRVSTYTLPRDFSTMPVAPGVEGSTDAALSSYTAMKTQLDALDRDRAAIEAALAASGDSGIAVDQLAYVEAVKQSNDLSAALQLLTQKQTELNTQRVRYTEENPEVQRLVRQVAGLRMRTLPDLARALMVQLAVRAQELDRRIAAAGLELQQVPRRSTEEQRRRRQVDLASTQYQLLEGQYQNAVFAKAAEEIGARVIDPAVVPSRPVKNTALMLLAAAVVGSLGIGVLFAIVLDFLDRRVRYPEQVSRDLGLPILGAVPRIRASEGRRGTAQVGTLQVVESLRGIRLALQHAHGVAGPMMVTITSPGPGEGKSFVASNLALAFADAGHRTILIDGDVRRGQLHRLLQGNRKPGLTDHLQGAVPRDEVIQQTRFPSLWFIGCGTRLHAAPELLASPAMGQLLLSLRGAYDIILVDSPPLGAGVDPYVLATATSNLLFVLRTGVTDRELAEAKLDMLDRLPIRILGAVLNDVQRGAAFRYYGYEHYYLDSYETRSEEDEEAADAAAEGHSVDVKALADPAT